MVVHDPDICYCFECSHRAWEFAAIAEEENVGRTKPSVVAVTKVRDRGEMPPFIGLVHRHFEKSRPAVASKKEATVTAPVDLLDMILPVALLDTIESLDIRYRRDR